MERRCAPESQGTPAMHQRDLSSCQAYRRAAGGPQLSGQRLHWTASLGKDVSPSMCRTYRLTHDMISICVADGKRAVRIIHRGDKVSLALDEHTDPRLTFVTWRGEFVSVFRRDFEERSATVDGRAGA